MAKRFKPVKVLIKGIWNHCLTNLKHVRTRDSGSEVKVRDNVLGGKRGEGEDNC